MKRKTVLVVEDEAIVSLSLKHCLHSWGFEAVAVPSGEEALVVVEQQLVQLILMDIQLQGKLDGVEAAAMIRQQKDIPVIFLTAYATPEIIARVKEIGSAGFLEKPYDNEILKEIINDALFKLQR